MKLLKRVEYAYWKNMNSDITARWTKFLRFHLCISSSAVLLMGALMWLMTAGMSSGVMRAVVVGVFAFFVANAFFFYGWPHANEYAMKRKSEHWKAMVDLLHSQNSRQGKAWNGMDQRRIIALWAVLPETLEYKTLRVRAGVDVRDIYSRKVLGMTDEDLDVMAALYDSPEVLV